MSAPPAAVGHEMDELLLRRDNDGEIHLAGTGAVSLRIIYDSVLGIGEQGVEFMAEIIGKTDSRPIIKVSENVSLSTCGTPSASRLTVEKLDVSKCLVGN